MTPPSRSGRYLSRYSLSEHSIRIHKRDAGQRYAHDCIQRMIEPLALAGWMDLTMEFTTSVPATVCELLIELVIRRDQLVVENRNR